MKNYLFFIAIFTSCLHATLLVDPGTNYLNCSDPQCKNEIFEIELPEESSFIFAAIPRTQMYISANGFINFEPLVQSQYLCNLLGNDQDQLTNIIAPLLQNLVVLDSVNQKIAYKQESSYIAITWLNMKSLDYPNSSYTFQLVWFNQDTQIDGVEFLAGDIIFSYGDMYEYGPSSVCKFFPRIGIAWNSFAYLYGTCFLPDCNSGGELDNPEKLPKSFVRFRWNGSGYVNTSLIPDVPDFLVNPSDPQNQNNLIYFSSNGFQEKQGSMPSADRRFYLFGLDYGTSISIYSSGYADFTSGKNWTCQTLNLITNPTINPLKADFIVEKIGSCISESINNNYYAITWNNVRSLSNPLIQLSFQMIWFDKDTKIKDWNFSAGDIVFCYKNIFGFGQTFCPSLQSAIYPISGIGQNEHIFAPLPGTVDGSVVSDLNLPSNFVLFHWDGQQYQVSSPM